MKVFGPVFAFCFLALSTAQASTLSYVCKTLNHEGPYGITKFRLNLQSTKNLKFTLLEDENGVSSKYVASYGLDENYEPKSDSMKAFERFAFEKRTAGREFGEGPITYWYVEKELANGGYRLRGGDFGGIVKTSGHGYSWSRFLCVRQD